MPDDESVPKPGPSRPGGAGDETREAIEDRDPADAARSGSRRRLSTSVLAAICAMVLLVIGGGVVASKKLANSYDLLANPSTKPSVPPPGPVRTVKPVPDAVRVKHNKLYTSGRQAPVNCKEPAVRPSSKAAVLKYYQALLPCLNRAWAPLVRKAGYEFRPPKLVLYDKGVPSVCSGVTELAFYCGSDETITVQWQKDLKNYRMNKLSARVDMLDTIAHEYGHHVQLLTHIMISSDSREDGATSKASRLEERRRLELQASCFAAVFLGANQSSLGLTGPKLDAWQFQARHSGDEYNPKQIRDHGSRRNHWLWAKPAFRSASPGSCNTFSAPAAKVS